MTSKGDVFVKGGLGCLGAFFVIGLVFVLVGGSMHIDIGGAVLLFVIGGVIGLIVLAIYSKGVREGRRTRLPRDPFDEYNTDEDRHNRW
ncbi:MAG: hypothetical protein ACYTG0_07360 [Planctomycetota bacterium]|jgi:hypothetical protein